MDSGNGASSINNAVPTSGQSALANDLDSVQPTPGLSSTHDVVPNSPQEQVMVGSELNQLDPYLYEHDILLDSFSWSKNDVMSRILWQRKITPREANQWIQYFVAPYNVWGGSLTYSAIIAGTGFNGGKLLFCKVPPNKDPNKMTVKELSIFAFFTLDPKEAAATAFSGDDQRIQRSHWNQSFDSDFGSISSTGGTICAVVLLPLITASTGNDSVNIAIFNKLGPDFGVSQLVPLRDENLAIPPPDIRPGEFAPWDPFNGILPFKIVKKPFSASTTLHANALNFDGKTPLNILLKVRAPYLGPLTAVGTQYSRYAINAASEPFAMKTNDNITFDNNSAIDSIRTSTSPGGLTTIFYDGSNPDTHVQVTNSSKHFQCLPITDDAVKIPVVQNLGESLVIFDTVESADQSGILQPDFLRDYIANNIGLLEDGLDLVFEVISNNIPVDYFRLNSEGYFSCNSVSQFESYTMSEDLYFRYSEKINKHERLPSLTASSTVARKQIHMEERLELLLQKLTQLEGENTELRAHIQQQDY